MATASVSHDASEHLSWHRPKKALRDNGLALTTGALFLAFAVGTLFVGTAGYNNELAEHGQATIPLRSYVVSGHFLEALFENRMA
ncbi:MAG TPA: DUF6766 family protein [Polyangiaceae bacterium]|nr:DUF6766 family protein [Polyangiaceae bacterium]